MPSTWYGSIINPMKYLFVRTLGWTYRHVAKHFFFLFDSEPIHEFVTKSGYVMGKIPGMRALLRACIRVSHPSLRTELAGIVFENPIGLSAGFDYEARLPRILSGLGFGFESMGTVTNGAYEGNQYPRIKRLVKSRSMLVNKGFKSSGIDSVLHNIGTKPFDIPIGISLGKTNIVTIENHEQAIDDVVEAFTKTESSGVPFAYFELNISCPNLLKDISFYEPARLRQLLTAVTDLKLSRPLFIKMPTVLTNEQTLALVDVVREFPVAAVIVGNLRKDRSPEGFDAQELEEFYKYKGNWSGKPTEKRADELIAQVYRHTEGKLPIIGVGGVFTAEDAYRKIRLGASLIQMATAPIFEGPQVPAEICIELPKLLARDGFKNLKEAVGVDTHS